MNIAARNTETIIIDTETGNTFEVEPQGPNGVQLNPLTGNMRYYFDGNNYKGLFVHNLFKYCYRDFFYEFDGEIHVGKN